MKPVHTIWVFAVIAALCVPARAQNTGDTKQDSGPVNPDSPLPPINAAPEVRSGQMPAAAARGVSAAYDYQAYDPSQVQPDTHTLAGAELLGLGSLEHQRNVFDSAVSFSTLGQSAPVGTGGASGPEALEILNGSLNFDRFWSRYRFTTVYNGGITAYQGYQQNNWFQHLAVAQEIEWNRWQLRLYDDFLVSPGAAFAGLGMGGPGLLGQFSSMLGSELASVGLAFAPGATIQTGLGRQSQNMALGELQYALSRQSTFTFSGSYGLLQFSNAGFVNSHDYRFQAGYDYKLDAKNSVAILANYGKIEYSASPASTSDYIASLSYGREITGRLAFQASAGPERIQVSGPGGSQTVTWSANSSLIYQRGRTRFSVAYARGLSNGSGVFFGATSHTVTGSLTRQLTRSWSVSTNGGYAFNRSLALSGGPIRTFNTWFIGGDADRRLGRRILLAFSYGLQKQYNPTVCPVPNCGGNGFLQTFGMTVNWHLHPVE